MALKGQCLKPLKALANLVVGVEGFTLSQAPQPQTYRVTKEHIKISSYLWALARFLQVKQLKRVTRGEIIDALSYPNNVIEHLLLTKGMELGLLSRVRTGLYNVDLDMADTLVHRIPLGYAGVTKSIVRGNTYMKEAEELWSAWNAFVEWHNRGAEPIELPIGAVHVLERYGIRPFMQTTAPNGTDVFIVDMKDIHLIMDKLTRGPYVFCFNYKEGAKLCAYRKYVLLRYLVVAPPQ
jgi:hypothetical protein